MALYYPIIPCPGLLRVTPIGFYVLQLGVGPGFHMANPNHYAPNQKLRNNWKYVHKGFACHEP